MPPAIPPPTIPTASPAGPKSTPASAPGQGALRGPLADRVELVVDVDVAAGERAADHEAIAAVVLDESDLVDPGDVADGVEHVGVRVVGAFDVGEHRECEVEVDGRAPVGAGVDDGAGAGSGRARATSAAIFVAAAVSGAATISPIVPNRAPPAIVTMSTASGWMPAQRGPVGDRLDELLQRPVGEQHDDAHRERGRGTAVAERD